MIETRLPPKISHPPRLAPVTSAATAAAVRVARLGKWELTRLVGQGRFSRVYRARPLGSGSDSLGDYAIKTLEPLHKSDPLARAMLAREAAVCAAVRHAHLISVLADHSAESPAFVVMPFCEGFTLARFMPGSPAMAVSTVCWIARQTAEALAGLHDSGWLHGDVRPANILLSPQGHATLLSLGLCRRLGTAECQPSDWLAAAPAYSAPEAFANGIALSAASDIYSLGVVLYELLASRPLFDTDSRAELSHAHRRLAPRNIRQHNSNVPGELAQLLKQMLAKEPLRRPAAAEVIRLLAEMEISELASGAYSLSGR